MNLGLTHKPYYYYIKYISYLIKNVRVLQKLSKYKINELQTRFIILP